MDAGQLHEQVAFDEKVEEDNGHGGVTYRFDDEVPGYVCRAHFRYLRGGEAVQSARLQGRQPVVVTIRASAAARSITTDGRMRDLRTGEVYAIKSGPAVSDNRAFLEFTVESGQQA